MSKSQRHRREMLAWPIVGCVVGALLMRVGSESLRAESVLHPLAGTLKALDPVCWSAPLFGALYALPRARFLRDASIVVFSALVGCGIAFVRAASSTSESALRNGSLRWEALGCCLAGCIVGAGIVLFLDRQNGRLEIAQDERE